MASKRRQTRMPKEHYSALKAVLELPEEGIQELYSALESTPRRMHISQFVSAVSAKVSTVRGDLDDLMDFLLTMASVFGDEDDSDASVADFIRDFFIEESRIMSEYEEVKPEDDNWEAFTARLAWLIGFARPFATLTKALDLWLEHENTIHDMQIVSDIRPIFKADPKQPPDGAMIVHRLKISYHESDKESVEEFFISLDSRDIDRLRALLDRAEQKAGSLRSVLEAAAVPLIEG